MSHRNGIGRRSMLELSLGSLAGMLGSSLLARAKARWPGESSATVRFRAFRSTSLRGTKARSANCSDPSIRELEAFLQQNEQWVIEGRYGDLVEVALPRCSELRFLNPGVEACVEPCRHRSREPEKFASREAQQAMLATLIDRARDYPGRDDECGWRRHRQIFESFDGRKREYTRVATYDDDRRGR